MIGNRLMGKVVIVAGASSGIGRVTARRLAEEGATLVLASPAKEADALARVVGEVKEQGGVAIAIPFDATDESSSRALVETTKQGFGGIDAIHANFADLGIIFQDTDAITVSDEVLERTLDVNLKGMLRLTRYGVPALLERGGGSIIYTSSISSISGEAVRPCYAMAKAGLNALVRHVASRWGKQGIRANAILPGFVLTEENRARVPSDFLARTLEETRSTRLGDPADIAAMVAFCSPRMKALGSTGRRSRSMAGRQCDEASVLGTSMMIGGVRPRAF